MVRRDPSLMNSSGADSPTAHDTSDRGNAPPAGKHRSHITLLAIAVFIVAVILVAWLVILPAVVNNGCGTSLHPSSKNLNESLLFAPFNISGSSVTYPVAQVCNGIEWSNLAVVLKNSSGTETVTNWSLQVTSSSGAALTSWNATMNEWSTGRSSPISAGDSLVLELSGALRKSAVSLVLIGVGGFSGQLAYDVNLG
jgi:hypothetical protein